MCRSKSKRHQKTHAQFRKRTHRCQETSSLFAISKFLTSMISQQPTRWPKKLDISLPQSVAEPFSDRLAALFPAGARDRAWPWGTPLLAPSIPGACMLFTQACSPRNRGPSSSQYSEAPNDYSKDGDGGGKSDLRPCEQSS